MINLRGAWEVRAGIIPGIPMKELTKIFPYSSIDYERDKGLADIIIAEKEGKLAPSKETRELIFTKTQIEVYNYARELTDPNILNWVSVDWIWY